MNIKIVLIVLLCGLMTIAAFTSYNENRSESVSSNQEDSWPDRQLIPLGFYVNNWDDTNHTIQIEVFDINETPIFDEEYNLESNTHANSTNITTVGGTYIFKATLDHNITEKYEFTMGIYEGPVDINIDHSNDSGASIVFGYMVE
nr:hypothetical protein [uncultured Methanolobus sp.]